MGKDIGGGNDKKSGTGVPPSGLCSLTGSLRCPEGGGATAGSESGLCSSCTEQIRAEVLSNKMSDKWQRAEQLASRLAGCWCWLHFLGSSIFCFLFLCVVCPSHFSLEESEFSSQQPLGLSPLPLSFDCILGKACLLLSCLAPSNPGQLPESDGHHLQTEPAS